MRRGAVALTPRPFDVLLVRDEDRLGREAIDTLSALKTIQLAGVRVVAYADDREVELGSMQANIMTFMRAEFAAEERRKAAARTAEAMRRRAEHGLVTGGTVFGYDTAARKTGGRENRVSSLQNPNLNKRCPKQTIHPHEIGLSTVRTKS